MNILTAVSAVPAQKATALDAGHRSISGPVERVGGPAEIKLTAPQVSDQAKTLSTLFESASRYMEQEYKIHYVDYRIERSCPGGYMNIEKYNNYLFDKAATTMVRQAGEQGMVIEKDDVLAELKSANTHISSLKFDDQGRRSTLGVNHSYFHLSLADLDDFTTMYITAKEHGLNVDDVERVAAAKGFYKSCEGLWVESCHLPIDFDRTETDPKKIEAARVDPPEHLMEKAREIKAKLQGDLGLGSGFMNYLLNPRLGLGGQAESTLDFLSRLIDIQNQQDKASS